MLNLYSCSAPMLATAGNFWICPIQCAPAAHAKSKIT